jgi:hypothetical protein
MQRRFTFKGGQGRIMSASSLRMCGLACLSRVGAKWSALVVAGLSVFALAASSAQAATGDLLRTISPANPQPCQQARIGVAFDGTNLLVSCIGNNVIDVVRPSDGSLVSTITATSETSLGALAWDATRGKVWACSPFFLSFTTGKIVLIDPATGASSNAITLNPGGCADGLAFDASNDTLWHSADASCTVGHTKTDGTAIATYNVCSPPLLGGGGNPGIAVGGQNLIMGGGANGRQIYTVDKNLSTSSVLFGTPTYAPEDLECDNITFAPKTALWTPNVNAGTLNAYEIPAGSCNFGGGSWGNWYSNGTLIPQGTPEPVTTSGTLTFKYVVAEESEVTCTVTDEEEVENPLGGGAGTDKITKFVLSNCFIPSNQHNAPVCGAANPEVIAKQLPSWPTALIPGSPLRDEITGVDLELKCSNGTFLETLTGTLKPTIGNSVLTFGAGSGALSQNGYPGTTSVIGTDSLTGPPGDEKITAENPHWYSNGKLITQGTVEPVTTGGALTFTVAPGGFTGRCMVNDKETIENPVGGGAGTDELTQYVLANCSAKPSPCPNGQLNIVAHHLNWLTHLVPGPPIRDVIEGIDLEAKCSNGAFLDTFRGTLMPTIGNSVANFGAGSGELRDPANRKVTVTGTDSLQGPIGDERVTAHNP